MPENERISCSQSCVGSVPALGYLQKPQVYDSISMLNRIELLWKDQVVMFLPELEHSPS
jgi:hypothetical protein